MMPKELTDEELEAQALEELEGGSAVEEPAESEPEEATTSEEDLPKEEEPAVEEPVGEEPVGSQEPEGVEEGDTEDHVVEGEEGEEEASETENDYGIKLEKPVKIKARGMEIDITDPAELITLAHKGFDYFKKTQELAQWRKDISVIEKGGLTTEELQILAELKNGNKEAAGALLKAYGVDPYELTEDTTFKPSGQFAPASEVEMVAQEILSQPELAEKVKQTVSVVPQDFSQKVSSDPNLLRAFADHVRTGLAEQIIPEAMKRQMIYGGNFFDHYTEVGEALLAGSQQSMTAPAAQPQAQQAQPRKELSDKERRLRQKAAPPRRGKKQSFIEDAEAIWDMSDEEFENAIRSGKIK
jgi:hypothetical protein